jgi:group I intron endonuclease
MNISGIYKIQSICKPERIYIGSAVNIRKRWIAHLSDLNLNKHQNKKLQNHYNKYGKDDFTFSILISCEKYELIQKEQYFLDIYKTWFNIYEKAYSPLGHKHSQESINKMKGNTNKLGKKCTEEAKEKLRLANIGKKASDATKQKMRESSLGNKYSLGHRASEETKHKLSEAHKNPSKETRLKLSNARKGKKRSEEYREKMHKIALERGWKPPSRKGVIMSEEEREKRKEIRLLNKQLKVA